MPDDRVWPALPLVEWAGTCETLHRWTQIVGKVRLALAPPENHWWHVPLYVTPRGLTTSMVPAGPRSFDIAFDFVDHQLRIAVSDGASRALPLRPQPVASFYRELMAALRDLGITVRIWPMPVEIPPPVARLDADTEHASYDAAAVERFWRALLTADRLMRIFRGRFIGKHSPVHFFWGSFDLASTRFSGRRAPARPDADAITREAYSHEVMSVGFWPGTAGRIDAAFYAYAAPEPEGFRAAAIRPPAAFYSDDDKIFIYRYEDARTAASPEASVLDFFQSTYDAAAALGAWDRAALERSS
jgi:uncharacterized protein DUF5996